MKWRSSSLPLLLIISLQIIYNCFCLASKDESLAFILLNPNMNFGSKERVKKSENREIIVFSDGGRKSTEELFQLIKKQVSEEDADMIVLFGKNDKLAGWLYQLPFCWRKTIKRELSFILCNKGNSRCSLEEKQCRDGDIEDKTMLDREPIRIPERKRGFWNNILPKLEVAAAAATPRKIKHYSGKIQHRNSIKKKQQEEMENYHDEDNKFDEKAVGSDLSEEEVDGDGEEQEEKDEDDDQKDEKELTNLSDKKRLCRYRLSCYAKKGIQLSEKQREKQSSGGSLLSSKMAPPKGGKRQTMRNAAKQAVKRMEEKDAENKVLQRKYEEDGEKVLADFWSELERKNKCKYRKSCYRTGIVPEIERSAILVWLSGDINEENGSRNAEIKDDKWTKREEKRFEEMDERQQKLFCRYRKSCYKEGNRAEIKKDRNEWWEIGEPLERFRDWWNNLGKKQEQNDKDKLGKNEEEREKKFKLECKYRRSCYETGKLPEGLSAPKSEATENEQQGIKVLGGKRAPTSVKELKLFCKYRKSCYIASATEGRERTEEFLVGPQSNDTSKANWEKENDKRPIAPNKPSPNPESAKKTTKDKRKMMAKKNCSPEKQKPTEKELKEKKKSGCAANTEEEKKEEPPKKEKKVPKSAKQQTKDKTVVKEKQPDKEMKVEKGEEQQKERKNKRYKIEEASPKVVEASNVWAKRTSKTNARVDFDKVDKLRCKYRRSCYESGIIPRQYNAKAEGTGWEWMEKGAAWLGVANLFGWEQVEIRKRKMPDKDIWERNGERERRLQCKYRKSCYNQMNTETDEEEKIDKNEIKEEEKVAKKMERMEERNQQTTPKTGIDQATKLNCKYRKSCYGSFEVGEKKVEIVHASQRNWTGEEGKCNLWRISCRQAMGLTIKEKAPIGPNGKKLCRKKAKIESGNDAGGGRQ